MTQKVAWLQTHCCLISPQVMKTDNLRFCLYLFGFLVCLVGCNVSCGPQESQPAKVNALPDNEQKASSHKGLSSAVVIELVPISIQPHYIISLFLCSQIAHIHSGCSSVAVAEVILI